MKEISRKSAIKNIVLGLGSFPILNSINLKPEVSKQHWLGNIHHSVCYWIYSKTPLEVFCKQLLDVGINTIDLIGPNDWATLKKLGMNLGIANGAEISLNEGWNQTSNHDQLIKNYTRIIPLLSSFGFNNLICFSGQAKGISLNEGLDNCFSGLKKIVPLAEKYKVTLTMELLNSKVDHPDYQCNHTAWGVELCKRIKSENFKLLYDIYHMQIMEGNIIETIQNNYAFISHYHTGGVPGRNEIDNTQELNYSAIMKAIVKTGYEGSVAQEFVPKNPNKMESLLTAFKICDV